jgi:hypothetical protein
VTSGADTAKEGDAMTNVPDPTGEMDRHEITFEVSGSTYDNVHNAAETEASRYFDGRTFRLEIEARPMRLGTEHYVASVTAVAL